MSEDTPIPGPLNNVIRIDDERIKGHLDRVVRGTVEETLNSLLDAEADRLCNAQRYERTEARRDIVSCAACHDQDAASNCVTCHRVGGPGGNPHPPGFTTKHPAPDINRNPMCLTCHN